MPLRSADPIRNFFQVAPGRTLSFTTELKSEFPEPLTKIKMPMADPPKISLCARAQPSLGVWVSDFPTSARSTGKPSSGCCSRRYSVSGRPFLWDCFSIPFVGKLCGCVSFWCSLVSSASFSACSPVRSVAKLICLLYSVSIHGLNLIHLHATTLAAIAFTSEHSHVR